jgi:osmoprotectant transport system substrate-binding protein
VISPPPTAANRIATPSGRVQCQPKKASAADPVFWVMKISSTIRIRKPAVNDVHKLAARVNLTADSGGGALSGTGADVVGGWSGDTDGSLLILPSSPFASVRGTEPPGNVGRVGRRVAAITDGRGIVSVAMSMLRRRGHRAAVWLAGICLVVTACGSSNPLDGASTSQNSIVVGSAGFPESKIVAEIYAQALQANGFNVGRQMGIGSRETYVPALKDHSIDLVPEYIGNLLLYFQPDATATMLDAVELELYKRLPGDLSILTPSPASDTDTVTVTAETAAKWNLKTIADLAAHSPEVKFAAPSDFKARPSGLAGLRQRYGLDIAPGNFVAISDDGGAVTVRTLMDGKVNAANIFSTSPAILQNHLVVLDDPLHNFLAGNIVPLVNSQKKSDHLKEVLDAVSAKLTSRRLADLNASVSGNSGIDPDQAARNWLHDNGFDHPIRS